MVSAHIRLLAHPPLGRDPSYTGPRALVSHFKVWDRALTRHQARLEHERTVAMFNATASSRSPSLAAVALALSLGMGGFTVPATQPEPGTTSLRGFDLGSFWARTHPATCLGLSGLVGLF